MGLREALNSFVACVPIIVANEWRESRREAPIEPYRDKRQVPNLAAMLGLNPDGEDASVLEMLLILEMDDPDNPPLTALTDTFEATGSVSRALQAALSVHGDPLHHGAGHHAVRMIYDVREVEDFRAALDRRLDSGERIYGIGHRISRTIDPRAVVLRQVLRQRVKGTELEWLVDTIEEIALIGADLLRQRKGVTVFPNLDLYNAAVVSTLGLPPEMNTQLFAVARSAGWTAHLIEMHQRGVPPHL